LNKIAEKLKNKHVLSLASNGLMAVMGLVIFAVLNRVLSLDANGIWIVFQSTFLLVDTFRSGFLSTAFVKFYAGKDEERALEVAGSAWYIAIGITLVFLLLNIPGYLFAHHLQDAGFSLFVKWFGVTFLASLPYLMATCILQAEERFDRLLSLRLVNQFSFVAGIIIIYFLGDINIEKIVYAYIASFLISSIFALLKGWTRVKSIYKKNANDIKDLYHFGKYSVGTILSANLFRTIDIYVINLMLTPSAVAIYNLGLKLMEVIEIPLRSLVSSGMPMMVAAFNKGKKVEVIGVMRKFVGMLTLAMIPILLGVILLADLPIAVIGGGKFMNTEAANVLRIFMVIALLYPADRFMALTLDVIHQPKVNFYKILVMLVVNLIADVIGVYVFGNIYGIVVASFFPVLAAIIIAHTALQKYFRFSFWHMYLSGYKDLKLQIVNFRNKRK
jgi:O-antigen/teichoic acid export membrane protein